MSSKWNDKFVEELMEKVPDKIKNKFDLELNLSSPGFVRVDEGDLNSVYFQCAKANRDSKFIKVTFFLKFKFRNFHYVKADFVFDRIYLNFLNGVEYRYDKNLNLDAKYLHKSHLSHNLARLLFYNAEELLSKERPHIINALNEWQELSKTEEIVCYQVEKNNKPTKTFYIIDKDKKPLIWPRAKNKILEITENFNTNKFDCFYKASLKDNKIIKENVVYITMNS